MSRETLRREYELLRDEATRLAGGLTDLAQRAAVYHHIFKASGGKHVFPLIAAHGTLWAEGYFRRALPLGRLLVWQYGWSPALRRRKLAQLDEFASAFRDINRRVCVDTYTNFHFTRAHGHDNRAAEFVAPELLAALNTMHAAERCGQTFTEDDRREVFTAHFLNEQQHLVGPAIERAVAACEWPLVKYLALRPRLEFAYFPRGESLQFRNFAEKEERIEKGWRALAHAEAVGWKATEQALDRYSMLPAAFFTNSVTYFADLRATVLGAA